MSSKKNDMETNHDVIKLFSIKRSARPWKCDICGSKIEKGNLYGNVQIKTAYDVYPKTFGWCLDCLAFNVKCLTFQLP